MCARHQAQRSRCAVVRSMSIWSAPAERSGDGALVGKFNSQRSKAASPDESGLPPHSKLLRRQRCLNAPWCLDKTLAPQLERKQSPQQLAMIRDAALMLVLEPRDVLGIEQTAATKPLRRQKIARQRAQIAFQPFREWDTKTFL